MSPCKRLAPPVLTGVLACLLSPLPAGAMIANPIGKVARMFNPRLVQVEDRVELLQRQLGTLAKGEEHALKSATGCRASRLSPTSPDPEVVLDLGAAHSLDSIYLVPAQREPAENESLFPRRFTVYASDHEDFSEAEGIFSTGPHPYPNPSAYPVKFSAKGIKARYLKLVVHEGRNRGVSDLFALSEIVVMSNSRPVSFGTKVTASGSLTIPGAWAPEYLTDGRMPLGVWQGGTWSPNHGDLVETSSPDESVSWSMDLGETQSLDRVILFPYELSELAETGVLPRRIILWGSNAADGSDAVKLAAVDPPLTDATGKVPLVLALDQPRVRYLRLVSTEGWPLGNRNLHALSEIEVWNGRTNLAAGKAVQRDSGGTAETVTTLTDNFASVRQILGVGPWLSQLNERLRIERELAMLLPLRTQMASESELNATWGAAVLLGMTFLIPVVIVERRRLISRNQLDQLRKRIASDLHDDIGSNLGSISLIARTARKDLARLQGPEEIVDDLGEVESIARESSLAMRDIVWLLERRQDSIGDLVQRMRETAGRLLREVDYQIDCKSTRTASKLTLDAKRHLFLFYKEAVHNIVKHSHAKHVSITLGDQGERLVLEVSDDGVGLPVKGDERTATVHKLQERARVLDGQLEIESTSGTGTLLRLVVKRANLIARPNLT